jgi:hypothetical protein
MKAVQPVNEVEFAEIMKKSVRFGFTDPVSVENFRDFYHAMSIYRRRWLVFYDFMACQNDRAVPQCTKDKDCLIDLFISPIPGTYAKNRSVNLRKENIKYRYIKHFIHDFWSFAIEDYKLYKGYRNLQNVTDSATKPNRGYNDKQPVSTAKDEDKKYGTDERKNYSNYPRRPFSPARPAQTSQRVNAMHEEHVKEAVPDYDMEEAFQGAPPEPDDESVKHYDNDDWGDPADDGGYNDDTDDFDRGPVHGSRHLAVDGLNTTSATPQRQPPMLERDTNRKMQYEKRRKESDASRGGNNGDQPAHRYGCWKMLQHGTCEHGSNCRFSHDPADLKRLFESMEMLVKSNSKKYGATPERKPGGTPALSSD